MANIADDGLFSVPRSMASKKTRQNHSIQHLLELPTNSETKLPVYSAKEPIQPPVIPTPRQVPVTVLHPTPKKVNEA